MPETTQKRRNRVFKSLHKPLTYMGIERTLFFFVAVSAVGMFNLFNSIIGGIIVFIGGCIFGHRVTNADPAFLKILGRSEKFKLRYDAAKDSSERRGAVMLNLARVIQPWKEADALSAHVPTGQSM